MKTFCYNDFEMNEQGDVINDWVAEITEEQILNQYWDYWSQRMIEKFGEGHYLIQPEKCIEDWCIVNWAWEKSKTP